MLGGGPPGIYQDLDGWYVLHDDITMTVPDNDDSVVSDDMPVLCPAPRLELQRRDELMVEAMTAAQRLESPIEEQNDKDDDWDSDAETLVLGFYSSGSPSSTCANHSDGIQRGKKRPTAEHREVPGIRRMGADEGSQRTVKRRIGPETPTCWGARKVHRPAEEDLGPMESNQVEPWFDKMERWSLELSKINQRRGSPEQEAAFRARYDDVPYCTWCKASMDEVHRGSKKHNVNRKLALALNDLLGDPLLGRDLDHGTRASAPQVLTVQGLEETWGPEMMQLGMKVMEVIKEVGCVTLRHPTKNKDRVVVTAECIETCFPAAVPLEHDRCRNGKAMLIPLSDLPRELGARLQKDHRAQPVETYWEWFPAVGIRTTRTVPQDVSEVQAEDMYAIHIWQIFDRPLKAWHMRLAPWHHETYEW